MSHETGGDLARQRAKDGEDRPSPLLEGSGSERFGNVYDLWGTQEYWDIQCEAWGHEFIDDGSGDPIECERCGRSKEATNASA